MDLPEVKVPSPHIQFQPSEQEMFDSMVDARIDEDPLVTLPDGVTARKMSGLLARDGYRFRPNGDDHETSIMEVYLLAPFRGPRPPAAKVEWLTPEQSWIDATVLGSSSRVFDQDAFNMPKVQRGLKASVRKSLPMARYQEKKIRHMHHVLLQWVGEDVD